MKTKIESTFPVQLMPKKKILIVDDEIEIRELTKKYLERRGYEAVGVGSGLLGLKLLSKESFDALISDINMPYMDGVEFTGKAKQLQPNLIVLLLSGYASFDYAQQAIKIGVQDYLTKPVELEKLQASLEEGLRQIDEKRLSLAYYQMLENELKNDRSRLESMKTELMTLISHELRTPVTIISTYFDLLKDTMDLPADEHIKSLTDAEKKRIFSSIERGRRRLISVIEDVNFYMDLSKGEVKLERIPVDIGEFLAEHFEMLQHLVRERKVVFKKEFSCEGIKINICKEKMLDVLERLIDNAAYHNPEGTEIVLKSYMAQVKRGASRDVAAAIIEVLDNGRGIDGNVLKNIFSPFCTGDISRHKEGAGMGLCICKKIVELHGGTLILESAEGKGTKVVIELPIRE